jgi:hypothetical protein
MAGNKPPYVVARLRASSVLEAGASINPTPDHDQPPGHCSIPEIKFEGRKSSKDSKARQQKLANASEPAHIPTRKS